MRNTKLAQAAQNSNVARHSSCNAFAMATYSCFRLKIKACKGKLTLSRQKPGGSS